ncbi:hypothetical protein GQ42DRAFT_159813, partial [Ramicandelaber brevisporus]
IRFMARFTDTASNFSDYDHHQLDNLSFNLNVPVTINRHHAIYNPSAAHSASDINSKHIVSNLISNHICYDIVSNIVE